MYHTQQDLRLPLQLCTILASPAIVHHFKDERSVFKISSLIKNLNTVGGAQNDVILYFSIAFNISAGVNFSWSYTKILAPAIHCPYSFPHTALPQPVSEIVKCRLFSSRLCVLMDIKSHELPFLGLL